MTSNTDAMSEDDALRALVADALSSQPGTPLPVQQIERRPIVESASHRLERVDVTLEDGSTLSLALKQSGPDGLTEAARRSRPPIVESAVREIQVYRDILSAWSEGVPGCRTSLIDADTGRSWLLLEWIDGPLLWRVGDPEAWLATARWAARLHVAFADRVSASPAAPESRHLLRHDEAWYRGWATRAAEFATLQSPEAQRHIAWLLGRYDRAIERLVNLPRTLVHGELFPANVVARQHEGGWAPCVLDWESAAIGPPPIDLACLVAGRWTDPERERLARAYFEARREARAAIRPGAPDPWPTFEDLAADLGWCRLALAVQWLGWSPELAPPTEQAHDWLAEAVTLAEQIGL